MVGGCGRPGASHGVLAFSLRSPLTEPSPDVAYWPSLCENSRFEFLRSFFWKVLPHFVLGLLDLLNPFHLYRTIFSKMKRLKRFHTGWARCGGSRQCGRMSAMEGEADGRRTRTGPARLKGQKAKQSYAIAMKDAPRSV
jgi:hypothetical protein